MLDRVGSHSLQDGWFEASFGPIREHSQWHCKRYRPDVAPPEARWQCLPNSSHISPIPLHPAIFNLISIPSCCCRHFPPNPIPAQPIPSHSTPSHPIPAHSTQADLSASHHIPSRLPYHTRPPHPSRPTVPTPTEPNPLSRPNPSSQPTKHYSNPTKYHSTPSRSTPSSPPHPSALRFTPVQPTPPLPTHPTLPHYNTSPDSTQTPPHTI